MTRKLGQIVKKLRLDKHSNWLVLIKSGSPLANIQIIEGLFSLTQRMGMNILFGVVDSFDDLSVLGEKEMNKSGWYYMPQLERMIKLKENGGGEKEEELKEID